MSKIGIIGGMGPQAGVLFNSTLFTLGLNVVGRTDMEHACRVAYLEGDGESPVNSIAGCAEELFDLGADTIVMACNTAHTVYGELLDNIPPEVADAMVNMVDNTVQLLKNQSPLWLGTTVLAHQTNLIRKDSVCFPNDKDQEIVQDSIWKAKLGAFPYDLEIRRIATKGPVIAGCTEMPLILNHAGVEFVDPAELLAFNLL